MNIIYFNNILIQADYVNTLSNQSSNENRFQSSKDLDVQIKYKTELCRNWELGKCTFGEKCSFAHGFEELRNKSGIKNNYRTKKCKQFHELGYCFYGNRCQFIHSDSSDSASSPECGEYSSRKSSNDLTKKRLQVFIELEKKGNAIS